jgi:hypothetical protein
MIVVVGNFDCWLCNVKLFQNRNKDPAYFGLTFSFGKKLISLDNPHMIAATPIEISKVIP